MKHHAFVWIALAVLGAAASRSSSQPVSQTPSITPQEPASLCEIFRIDPSSGAPAALEHVKLSQYSRGLGMGRKMVESYVEGGASPAAYKTREPQEFAIRLLSPADRYGRDLTPDEVRKHVFLALLVVQNLKDKPERFLSKTSIPLDVQSYGQVTPGLDPKKPGRTAQSFRLTPHTLLAPGEYLISIYGTHDFELQDANMLLGGDKWAFGIVDR